MLVRRILSSARAEFNWIAGTYGISRELEAWCGDIVAEADKAERPLSSLTELAVDDVWELLESGSDSSPSHWKSVWKRFRSSSWSERFKAIRATLTHRQPPWQLRANARIFPGCGGGVPVEVHTVYDINLPSQTVTFLVFEYFTPDRVQTGAKVHGDDAELF